MLSTTRLGQTSVCLLVALLVVSVAFATPPKLTIVHFDVNVGDATLVLSPDGHAVLIDAGNRGRGLNPIGEFLERARGKVSNSGLNR